VKLILIRHPETEANAKRLIYGRTESEYTEKGRASVATVVEQLSEVEIHCIYSSPLKRASDLAKAIADSHSSDSRKLEVIIDDRLQEMHFGIFENKTNEEARELYGDGFDHFLHDFANFVVPEGESLSQVRDRAVEFLKELLASESSMPTFEEMVKQDPVKAIERWEAESKTVVIVAHSLLIRGALSWLLNIPLNEIWRIDIKPAAIVEVSYRGGYGFLTGLR
jgi:alpha-ribazole phosphatase